MADSTRRVSVRLSLDDAARVKQELREVGETGQRSLERIQGGADRASRGLNLLTVAVRGVQIAGLAAGLRAVVVAGDALTQSMGRLNTALGSVERAGEIYERLYRDSLQTGVAVRESVDAFARFSIAAREIGATSAQVATLVGGLQRIAIASGASQQEIASSTQQLAQALASGTLQATSCARSSKACRRWRRRWPASSASPSASSASSAPRASSPPTRSSQRCCAPSSG